MIDLKIRSGEIFVFGSNLAGKHGSGAAKDAKEKYGAIYGQGEGIQGKSYGIPTKDTNIKTLPLSVIAWHVLVFKIYARQHPNQPFFVTRIGCGLAGYEDKDIAPFFKDAPSNCRLPIGWREW